eukprot:6180857-Pleurochrysis_carterae.AAC.1
MAHAALHANVQPGKYGQPMHDSDMDQHVLDSLHLAKLGLPKTPWKFGVMNNASDDARAAISEQLAEWKHPLDCRRKDNNRVRENKWFTGEKWSTFCAGERGSPGAPIAIATIVMIIAKDLQARGVNAGAAEEASAADADRDLSAPAASEQQAAARRGSRGGQGGRGSRGGRGRSAFASRVAATASAVDTDGGVHSSAEVQHVPTAAERSADPDELAAIREMFGSRAQTLVNILLAFDAYFKWYFPFEASIPLLCDYSIREARAFDNMRDAIDMLEVFERVSIRSHKSFLPHGAVFK